MEKVHKKKNRVIILVDLFQGSSNLIDFGLRFSHMLQAKVVFVHRLMGVFPSIAEKAWRDKIYQIQMRDASRILQILLQDKPCEHASFIINAKPIDTILLEMRSAHFTDWMIGGIKEPDMLKQLVFGNTLGRVINYTDILALAVPIKEYIHMPDRITIAVTKKYPLNTSMLAYVLGSLAQYVKEVEFLTVSSYGYKKDAAHDYLLYLQEQYRAFNPKISLIEEGDKCEGIKKHIQQYGPSFLLIQEGSRTLMDEFFRKYMVNDLLQSVQTPLIVLPNQ